MEWPRAREFQALLERALKKVSKSLVDAAVELALEDEKQVRGVTPLGATLGL